MWLRGFSDMQARKRALESFYGGPVWKQHSRAANATMIDSDNVLLLRPVSGLELDGKVGPRRGGTAAQPGLLVVTIYPLATHGAADFPEFFRRELEPALRDAGVSVLATYATERSQNTFPALPVRRGRGRLRVDGGPRGRGRPSPTPGAPRTVDALARTLASPCPPPRGTSRDAQAAADRRSLLHG